METELGSRNEQPHLGWGSSPFPMRPSSKSQMLGEEAHRFWGQKAYVDLGIGSKQKDSIPQLLATNPTRMQPSPNHLVGEQMTMKEDGVSSHVDPSYEISWINFRRRGISSVLATNRSENFLGLLRSSFLVPHSFSSITKKTSTGYDRTTERGEGPAY